MWRNKRLSVVIITILFMMTGCATRSINQLENKKNIEIGKESSYNRVVNNSPQTEAKRYMDIQLTDVRLKESSVYDAVAYVAKISNIPFDTTFKPESTYKVTMNYNGTVGEFLSAIYTESGIEYKYRNGLLRVFNKNDVEKSYNKKECTNAFPSIIISLDSVPPSEVFKYLSKNYSLNFLFKTKFYALSAEPEEGKVQMNNVSFYHRGCDKIEAVRSFIKANDLKMDIDGKNIIITDYETAEIDIPTYYDVAYKSDSGGIQSQSDIGGLGESGSTVSIQENFKKEFVEYIQTKLSARGKAYISARGYLIVTDVPSSVKEIKELLRTERQRQKSIDLSVSIIRIDLNDKFEMGVDWSKALTEIAEKTGYTTLGASYSFAGLVGNGLTIKGQKDGLTNMVTALQQYGQAKIVRDYNMQTRSGVLSSFKAVEEIPYITTSVTSNSTQSETAVEAKVAEAGIVLNIIPTLSSQGEIVNLATSIKISEYKGDKVFLVNGAEYKMPQINTNQVNMPANVHINDTIIMTGIKLKQSYENKDGVPGASQVPGALGGLFGSDKQYSAVSEYLIVVTPKSTREY